MSTLQVMVLAAGALGTAAFGIVEGLKGLRFLGEAGFGLILAVLGPLFETLRTAYGPDAERLLRAQYRGDHKELARVIRQGARIGLTPENAEQIALALGMVEGARLKAAAVAVETGEELPADLRNVLGRFELAVDARIDAAIALALDRYAGTLRIAASVVAMSIALAVGIYMAGRPPNPAVTNTVSPILLALLVGIGAVPLAPIAKDVVTAVKSAAQAIAGRVP